MVGLCRTLPEPRSQTHAMNRSVLTVKYDCTVDSLISNENRVLLSSAHSQCVNLTESGVQDAPLFTTATVFWRKELKGITSLYSLQSG